MIREFAGQPLFVCCISSGRSQHVRTMRHLVGDVTWYVPEDQWSYYEAEGARAFRVGSATDAAVARNRAFGDAWEQNVPCCQLDDDMRWAKLKDFKTGQVRVITGEEAITRVLVRLMLSDFKLGGIPNTNNPFFSRSPLTTRTHVRSHLWIVKPCELLLDVGLHTKFDYDYTLQHIARYGGVCRVDEVICDFDYNTLPGGHVGEARMAQQERDIRRLERRWGPNVIKRNKRRSGEIIIHPRQNRREVLT